MKYFGTDGFRGEAGTTLTVEHAYKIGRYVGWYYGARQNRKARVIVGKDTRRSSYMFESGLVSGLVASGADAYMLHVIPHAGRCVRNHRRLLRLRHHDLGEPQPLYR